ncbi:MAG: PEGA domain-containing protein [Ignavibacteria bacterium]|nr:PEGA domain-containing protein [Ignavibacteria bacterium]
MTRLLILTVIAFGLFVFNACSTIMHSTTQVIEFKTNPPNAKITIDGKKFGTSPQVVNIERGTSHIIKIELDGFEVYETQITRKISFWFWGNALNAFIPGMVIDMFTGSMYNLLPEKIDVELSPAKVEIPNKKR